jgi:hypothetical protein
MDISKVQLYLDLLRNEKPVFYNFRGEENTDDSSILGRFSLQTLDEPVGEYEERTISRDIKPEPKQLVKEYLHRMGYEPIEKEGRYLIPFDIENEKYNVLVFFHEEWVETGTLLVESKELPEALNKEGLYARLLMDTLYAREVTYGLTTDGNVIVHAETAIKSLSFDNFQTEFNSVLAGIKHFVSTIKKDYPIQHKKEQTTDWSIKPV